MGSRIPTNAESPYLAHFFSEAGVRLGLGGFGELWGGFRWRRKRALLGLELAWSHHRHTAPVPRTVTTTNQMRLRLIVGVHPGA